MIDFAERSREILRMRRAGMTLQEIGGRFNLSRERVRQIVWRAERTESGRCEPQKWKFCTDAWWRYYDFAYPEERRR
jgi:hypothetical protein